MNPQKPANTSGSVMDVQKSRINPEPVPATGEQPPNEPKKKNTALIVGIISGIVALLIIAGVIGFIWYKNNSKPAPAATSSQSENERVNVEEIDATIAEIDKTLNTLNDSKDITPGDVSDNTLGL